MYVSTKPASVSSLFAEIIFALFLDLIAILFLLLITHATTMTAPTMTTAQAGTSTAGSTAMRFALGFEVAGGVNVSRPLYL